MSDSKTKIELTCDAGIWTATIITGDTLRKITGFADRDDALEAAYEYCGIYGISASVSEGEV